VIFNTVLHVVFLKLNFEIKKTSALALLLILSTIAINYALILVFSLEPVGNLLDPDLVGVSARSVFNLSAFVLTIGVCCIVLFIEYLFCYLRMFKLICNSGQGRQQHQ